MKKVHKAYLAGIVDGEGTVTLMRHHRGETPSPSVSIANNNERLLRWVKSLVGGVIVRKPKRNPRHQDSFAWVLRFDAALRFLQEIQEFLIIKKPQATLILRDYKKCTHRAGRYDAKLMRKKNALVAKIRKLNHR